MVHGVLQCPVQLLGAHSFIVLYPSRESSEMEDLGPEYHAMVAVKRYVSEILTWQ